MSNNKILKKGDIALFIFKILYLGSFLFFIAVIISWFIDRTLWESVDISSGFKAGFGVTEITFLPKNFSSKALLLSDISVTMIFWLLLRNSLFFILGWMILLQVSKILKSIQSIEVFYSSNIESFQKIGKLLFIIAVLSFFNFYVGERGAVFDLTLPFTPILFGFASLVLAEVFKEGKALSEDKKSII